MSDENNPFVASRMILKVNSNETKSCPLCKPHGSFSLRGEDWEVSMNHLLDEHDGTLLHVGSEWAADIEGKSSHHTVGVVGFDAEALAKFVE